MRGEASHGRIIVWLDKTPGEGGFCITYEHGVGSWGAWSGMEPVSTTGSTLLVRTRIGISLKPTEHMIEAQDERHAMQMQPPAHEHSHRQCWVEVVNLVMTTPQSVGVPVPLASTTRRSTNSYNFHVVLHLTCHCKTMECMEKVVSAGQKGVDHQPIQAQLDGPGGS